ncbi:Inner membrane protein YihY, formerly thought to be RNase BN [Lachnospiraceae bacterium TWA4]|nr:Inner membrane protein YihY, formerly thought to be RNase BN [Lachnospiraceae bacterium TWA4]
MLQSLRSVKSKRSLYEKSFICYYANYGRRAYSICFTSCFFIVISAFPMLMLLLSIIQFVSPEIKDSMIHYICQLTPDRLSTFVTDCINEIYTKSSGGTLSFSVIATLWSASKGFNAIQIGLNKIYKTTKELHFIVFRLVNIIYTFIFLIIFWLFLVTMMFGDILKKLIAKHLPTLSNSISPYLHLRLILAIIVLIAFFTMMYGTFPGRRAIFIRQLPGAIFAAFGWIGFSYGYAFYMNHFSNFSYMYGSLTAIILLLLWVYFSMIILLLGAEFNILYPRIKSFLRKVS